MLPDLRYTTYRIGQVNKPGGAGLARLMPKRIAPINSITAIALFTYTLAIAPLVVALLTSTFYVNRLNEQGQTAIQRAVVITDASQKLAESVIAMERSARQYSVLRDPELFTVYLDRRGDFSQALERLDGLPISGQMRALLAEVRRTETATHEELQATPLDPEQAARLVDGFAAINDWARVIREEGSEMIALAVGEMQASSQRADKLMFWQLAGLVPVLAITTILVLIYILRPIRHLDKVIRRLGKGELDAPIAVAGSRDLQELGDSLDWMRQRIRELENEKTLFLRHMSHELKTPLTNLREGSELLSEGIIGELNEDQVEVARLLRYNSLRLQEQIENLLNFSITQSQQLTLDLEHFDLNELVGEVVRDNGLAIRSKNLVTTVGEEPVPITADREKLRMILDNLLSNAVKYSPEGGALGVSVVCEGDQLAITVADSGPGIPEEERERIFDAFFQGANRPDSVIKGTGVGLSICRAYTELHGGRIFAKKSDLGAELCVMIPHRRDQTLEKDV